MHSFVERQLIARIGDAGRRLHTGRSRNEQVSLDLRLYLRRRIPLLQQSLAALVGACADQAEQAGDALMPSYTHFRRAQPVLVAHFFLSHAAALRRDAVRLDTASAEADALTLGSGAIAGTSYAIDTAQLARTLGFSRVVGNSMDASSDRDFVASFLYATSLAMVHLSRLAEDLIIFTGEEHGFFELADASATGSSMMPQKKNPDPLELVRGKSGRAIGRLAGWLATMKGLPTGYNKDLQEDKEAVFDAEATLGASLRAAHAVVSRLSINADRTGRAASGLLLATDVADYLVSRGMPFRRAHEVVGAMVRRLLAEGVISATSPWTNGVTPARCSARMRPGRDGAGVGAGTPDPAVHQSGGGTCRPRGVPGVAQGAVTAGPGIWHLGFGSSLVTLPGHLHFFSRIPPEGIGSGGVHAATPASAR